MSKRMKTLKSLSNHLVQGQFSMDGRRLQNYSLSHFAGEEETPN